jgi:hypothetical protein
MRKVNTKCCVDCLHCKVSAKSTDKVRLCFCDETANRKLHREMFWLSKVPCRKFDDMGNIKRKRKIKEVV